MPPAITILTPLRAEARAIRRARPRTRVLTIGPRAVRLPDPREFEGSWVLVAGFAGGLAPELARGDVVVDGGPPGWALRSRWRMGTIHTAQGLVGDPEQKASLHAATGALAVDMELGIVRAALRGAGARVVGVRSILDTAQETLPAWLGGAVGAGGAARPGPIASRVLWQPQTARELVTMAGWARAAGAGLAEAVGDLVRWIRDQTAGAATEGRVSSA